MTLSESQSLGDWTIQLLVEGRRDAALLEEWLPSGWTLVDGEAVDPSTDLVLADEQGLQANAEAIASARSEARPTFLPVVAMLSGDGSGSPLQRLGVPTDLVDEIVETPVGKWELGKRVESQLHARTLSMELASREAQYRGLVELLPEAILIVEDSRIQYTNDAACELLGEDDDLDGREVASLVVPDDRERLTSLLSTLAGGGTVDEFVGVTVERPDSTLRECELTGVRVKYGGREATQLIVRDVTDRNRRRRQVELFQRALDDTNQGVTIADARQDDLPLIYANAAFERITGYPISESLGINCRFLQGPETDEATVAEIREALERREPVTAELLNYRKDGTPFYNELSITPVRDDTGEVTHFIGFQTDVTERVEREQRLSEFEAVLQAAGDPIVAVDGSNCVTTVNEAFCSFVDKPRQAVLGTAIESLLDPEGGLVETIETVSAGKETRRIDTTVIDGQAEQRYCEVTVAPRESVPGAVIVIRDVTDDRRRRQRITVLDRLLRHNLRNKMNVVLGRTETVLAEGAIDEQRRSNMEAVVAAAEELLELVDDVREIHDLLDQDEGRESLEMAELVQRHLEGVAMAYPEATVERDLADLTVVAHPSVGIGIDQLLENAFKHNSDHDPTVRVTLEREGPWATLTVSDDGPGIPPEELAVMSAESETPLEHSQGVGIWLARWSIEQSGGLIDVEVDGGTTVTVRLPLAT